MYKKDVQSWTAHLRISALHFSQVPVVRREQSAHRTGTRWCPLASFLRLPEHRPWNKVHLHPEGGGKPGCQSVLHRLPHSQLGRGGRQESEVRSGHLLFNFMIITSNTGILRQELTRTHLCTQHRDSTFAVNVPLSLFLI